MNKIIVSDLDGTLLRKDKTVSERTINVLLDFKQQNKGLFNILIQFPENYPNAHPEVRFKTPIYHLNVNPRAMPNNNNLGDICLSVLNFWKPEYKVTDIIVSIYALFHMVNPESPYGFDRRDEYINNKALYEEKVRYFTRKYANPSHNNIDREYNEVWDFSFHP